MFLYSAKVRIYTLKTVVFGFEKAWNFVVAKVWEPRYYLPTGLISCHENFIVGNLMRFILDVDECAEGLHHCDNNSVCVNMPGWYYCECQKGYRRKVQRNSLIAQCQGWYSHNFNSKLNISLIYL